MITNLAYRQMEEGPSGSTPSVINEEVHGIDITMEEMKLETSEEQEKNEENDLQLGTVKKRHKKLCVI